jgi:hypothetical protein
MVMNKKTAILLVISFFIIIFILLVILKLPYIILIFSKTGLTDDNSLISYDINNPMFKEKITFLDNNFSKLYDLRFQESGLYEIGLLDQNEMIPLNVKFKGKVRFQFINDKKIVLEKIISDYDVGLFSQKNKNDFYKALIFFRFEVPIVEKYYDYSLSVQVLTAEVVPARRVPPLTQTLAVAGYARPCAPPATTGLCHPWLPGCCVCGYTG